MRWRTIVVLALLAASVIAAQPVASTWSSWTSSTANSGTAITATSDWEAPVVSTTVAGKFAGGITGYIHQNADYYVYANVADGGNPASGIKTLTANVTAITSGSSAVPLVAGSFSAGGVTYSHRSAVLRSNTVAAEGSRTTTISTTDVTGNAAVVAGPGVIVDNTVPAGSSVQTSNGGGIAKRPDNGDKILLRWSEQLDPSTMLASWSGDPVPVRVYIYDSSNGVNTIAITTVDIHALPLGTITVDADYVSSYAGFEASMTQSGAAIDITLGLPIGGSATTHTRTAKLTWAISAAAGPTDRSGNAVGKSTVLESGAADADF
jgi:hypothetical protein